MDCPVRLMHQLDRDGDERVRLRQVRSVPPPVAWKRAHLGNLWKVRPAATSVVEFIFAARRPTLLELQERIEEAYQRLTGAEQEAAVAKLDDQAAKLILQKSENEVLELRRSRGAAEARFEALFSKR